MWATLIVWVGVKIEGPKTCKSLPKKILKTWEGINARTKIAYNNILSHINLLEKNKCTHNNLKLEIWHKLENNVGSNITMVCTNTYF